MGRRWASTVPAPGKAGSARTPTPQRGSCQAAATMGTGTPEDAGEYVEVVCTSAHFRKSNLLLKQRKITNRQIEPQTPVPVGGRAWQCVNSVATGLNLRDLCRSPLPAVNEFILPVEGPVVSKLRLLVFF